MGYSVETRWGGSEESPTVERMQAILAELDMPDEEHPDTWLTHDSGWTLTADESGRLELDNAEDPSVPPQHMRGVSRDRVLELWQQLAAGNVEEVARAAWQPGSGLKPLSEEKRVELDAALLAIDRTFYDSLGPEREEPRCRAHPCSRGTVIASVFCRVHQFENAKRKPCPFSH